MLYVFVHRSCARVSSKQLICNPGFLECKHALHFEERNPWAHIRDLHECAGVRTMAISPIAVPVRNSQVEVNLAYCIINEFGEMLDVVLRSFRTWIADGHIVYENGNCQCWEH